MRNFGLRNRRTDAAGFVAEAAGWTAELVREESRGPGDYGNAMRRVARKTRVPFSALWNLRYRPPKTVAVHVYVALGEAVNEQRRRYKEERQHVEPRTRLGRTLLGQADLLGGEDDGALNDARASTFFD